MIIKSFLREKRIFDNSNSAERNIRNKSAEISELEFWFFSVWTLRNHSTRDLSNAARLTKKVDTRVLHKLLVESINEREDSEISEFWNLMTKQFEARLDWLSFFNRTFSFDSSSSFHITFSFFLNWKSFSILATQTIFTKWETFLSCSKSLSILVDTVLIEW